MKIGKSLFFLLLGAMMFAHTVLAQSKSKQCKDINVKVDLVTEASSTTVLKISFEERGDFKVQLLDSRGEIRVLKDLTIRDLKEGEYDLIITDLTDSNRCPFYKRIKIDGQ